MKSAVWPIARVRGDTETLLGLAEPTTASMRLLGHDLPDGGAAAPAPAGKPPECVSVHTPTTFVRLPLLGEATRR